MMEMRRLQGEQLQILAASTSGLRRPVEWQGEGAASRREGGGHPAAFAGQRGEDGECPAPAALDVGAV